jgi:hypothetical protein
LRRPSVLPAIVSEPRPARVSTTLLSTRPRHFRAATLSRSPAIFFAMVSAMRPIDCSLFLIPASPFSASRRELFPWRARAASRLLDALSKARWRSLVLWNARAVFAVPNRLDLFPDKLAGLRGRRFALAFVATRPFDGILLRHNGGVSCSARLLDLKIDA